MTGYETILLGGGCFWCVEAVFKDLRGVISIRPGYAGGAVHHPVYEQVCAGHTGHAEVVEINYDPEEISLNDLLRIFFTTHDPTQLNRQGNDVGTQYRSVIFGNQDQQKIAQSVKKEIDEACIWPDPVVTSIEGPTIFWEAEAEHHDYYTKHQNAAYCRVVITPKIIKARKLYQSYFLKDSSENTRH